MRAPVLPWVVILPSISIFFACRSEPKPEEASAPPVVSASPNASAQKATEASSAAKPYGAPITPMAATQLSALLEKPSSHQGKPLLVEGVVRRNCTRKGCWMELAESMDMKKPSARVTFKDYAFFVPLDSAGSTARVQGNVEVETVEADHVKHLEEEGAVFASKNPDGTANEIRLVASGVELSKATQ